MLTQQHGIWIDKDPKELKEDHERHYQTLERQAKRQYVFAMVAVGLMAVVSAMFIFSRH